MRRSARTTGTLSRNRPSDSDDWLPVRLRHRPQHGLWKLFRLTGRHTANGHFAGPSSTLSCAHTATPHPVQRYSADRILNGSPPDAVSSSVRVRPVRTFFDPQRRHVLMTPGRSVLSSGIIVFCPGFPHPRQTPTPCARARRAARDRTRPPKAVNDTIDLRAHGCEFGPPGGFFDARSMRRRI